MGWVGGLASPSWERPPPSLALYCMTHPCHTLLLHKSIAAQALLGSATRDRPPHSAACIASHCTAHTAHTNIFGVQLHLSQGRQQQTKSRLPPSQSPALHCTFASRNPPSSSIRQSVMSKCTLTLRARARKRKEPEEARPWKPLFSST